MFDTMLIQSLQERVVANAEAVSPRLKANRLSVEFDQAVIATISSLLLHGRPSNVAGFVISVIVDSVELQTWRRHWANMFQKCAKVAPPFSADGNASPAITVIRFCVRVEAPREHRYPRLVFWSSSSSVLAITRVSVLPAAATLLPILQGVANDGDDSPALAAAFPKPATLDADLINTVKSDDSEPIENFAGEIGAEATVDRILFSHDRFLSREGMVVVRVGGALKRPTDSFLCTLTAV